MWWSRYWRKIMEDMEKGFEEIERMMEEFMSTAREGLLNEFSQGSRLLRTSRPPVLRGR